MENIIFTLINKDGYFSIMFLIAIENIFPPIPSEVILCFSGFISLKAKLNLLLIIIFATIGSLIGAIILYFAGFILNKDKIILFTDSRLGKLLHFKKDNVITSIQKFESHGNKTIFFCRFIPIIRSLISIPAGIAHYHFGKFIFFTTIGSFIWNSILILLGNMMGENWDIVANIFGKISWPLLIIITIIYLLRKHYKKVHSIEVIPYSNF